MALYINKKNKITDIFVNVGNNKKKIKTAWVNKDGIVTKVFGELIKEVDPYDLAPADAYINWNYTLDDTNNIITLNYYTGAETDVVVYANYEIDGKTYKTLLKSNDAGNVYSFYMFNGVQNVKCQNIHSITFSGNIDTTNITNMNYMFCKCITLTKINFGNSFDTSNVTSMCSMFNGCVALTDIDVSKFNVSNVTNMNSMFINCSELQSLNLSNWDTSNVTDMNSMFSICTNVRSLDISSFDTHNVTNMNSMFNGCLSLVSLDLSNFDTSKVTNMQSMFSSNNMYKYMLLESLDLSSFNTSNVTNMINMFYNCRDVKTIYVTKEIWKTPSQSYNKSNMFYGCGTSSVTYK